MMSFLLETPQRDPYLNWVLVALAVGTIFYVAVIRPAMGKKNDPLERSPFAGSLTKERTVERQMQNLLVELSEMSRQISAQLDTRTQKLHMLIQDADERITALQKLQKPAESVRTEIVWTAPTLPAPRPEPASEPVVEQHQQVYTLADNGHSAGDIARELNRPRGEVELILALRPREESAKREVQNAK